jgi:hypothetical protein
MGTFGITLRGLPLKAKVLVTFVLLSFLFNHAFAVLLVHEVTTKVDPGAREHFSYKSLAILLRMAHQHFFGHGVMYFITAGIFLLADVAEWLTILLIFALFTASWLDIVSWFGLKYRSARWEWLSIGAGTTYAGVFLIMTTVVLYQMWRGPEVRQ